MRKKVIEEIRDTLIIILILAGIAYIILNPNLYPSEFRRYDRDNFDCKHFSVAVGEKIEAKYPDAEVWVHVGDCGINSTFGHAWINVDGVDYETISITRKLLENCTVEYRVKPSDYGLWLNDTINISEMKIERVSENGKFR